MIRQTNVALNLIAVLRPIKRAPSALLHCNFWIAHSGICWWVAYVDNEQRARRGTGPCTNIYKVQWIRSFHVSKVYELLSKEESYHCYTIFQLTYWPYITQCVIITMNRNISKQSWTCNVQCRNLAQPCGLPSIHRMPPIGAAGDYRTLNKRAHPSMIHPSGSGIVDLYKLFAQH